MEWSCDISYFANTQYLLLIVTVSFDNKQHSNVRIDLDFWPELNFFQMDQGPNTKRLQASMTDDVWINSKCHLYKSFKKE